MIRQSTPSDRRQDVLVMAAALVVLSWFPGVVTSQSQSPAGPGGTAQSRDLREHWKSERVFREKVSEEDRKELVVAAPKGFNPNPKAKSPSLKLTLKSPVLKAGEHLSYSLSLTNRGTSSVRVLDDRAFFKRPRLNSSIEWQFWLTAPDGARVQLAYGDTADLAARRARNLPLTAQEESAAIGAGGPNERARRDWESDARASLDIVLKPGETLRNRACSEQADHAAPPANPAGPGFCEYPSDQSPKIPGRYRLTVIMVDQSPPVPALEGKSPSSRNLRYVADFKRAHAHHLGRVESNAVEFELVP